MNTLFDQNLTRISLSMDSVLVAEEAARQPLQETAFIEAEPTSDPLDLAAMSSLEFNESVLKQFQLEQAEKSAHAQERKQQGLNEVCESCHKRIDPERLAANPNATRCCSCQKEYERLHNHSRPQW